MYVYLFAGSKEHPDWYYTKSKLSKPYFGYDKEAKPRFRCYFFADNCNHIGVFCILSLKQMIVLPFLHRLYFSEKRAKRRQKLNLDRKERNAAASLDELHGRPQNDQCR